MGQRHNRRRTRPRSYHRSNPNPDTLRAPVVNSSPSLAIPSSIWSPTSPSEPLAACISPGSPVSTPAPTWHYGYTAWQIRESSRLHAGGLEAEQCRLFGGEPGDDVSLCFRMLEYFGGLDYIDSARNSAVDD